MPVLLIAVVFFILFLVIGVMAVSAMVAEHKGHLFSGHWSDGPVRAFFGRKPKEEELLGKPRLFGSEL